MSNSIGMFRVRSRNQLGHLEGLTWVAPAVAATSAFCAQSQQPASSRSPPRPHRLRPAKPVTYGSPTPRIRYSATGRGWSSVAAASLCHRKYVDAADTLYLAPRGFTGSPQALDTPEGFYPTTGVNSSTADASEAQGSKILDAAILGQIATGHVDADNPIVVFGYSQSSAFASMTMQQLESQGVPSDDVHFVLVGDTAAPTAACWSASTFPAATCQSRASASHSPTRLRPISTRPTFTRSNTTASPISRSIRSIRSPTSTHLRG